MSRGRATFRQSDVTRALKAACKGGQDWRVEIDPQSGKIILIRPTGVDASVPGVSEVNEWDEVK